MCWDKERGTEPMNVVVMSTILTFVVAATAHAETAYCRAVRARAASEAAMMVSPQVVLQALRIPRAGDDLHVTVREQNQGRAGMAWSLAGLRKGLALRDVADADCARHEAQVKVESLLAVGSDLGKLRALEVKKSFLSARRNDWRKTQEREERRFQDRMITLPQLAECRARIAELERRIVQADGESSRIAAQGFPVPSESLQSLAEGYISRTLAYEEKMAKAVRTDGWQLRLAGGVVPTTNPIDWYGQVELSFNTGALFRGSSESRYLDSRAVELRESRYQLGPKVRELRDRARSLRQQAERELDIVDGQLSFITKTLVALEGSDSVSTAHSIALLTLDQIASEAERSYLSVFIADLSLYETEAADEQR